MKSILAKLRWPDIPLPVVAVLAAAVVVLPASQLAVLGLLRATQKSAVQSTLPAPPSGAEVSSGLALLPGDSEAPAATTGSDGVGIDPLLALAAAVNRGRRAGERLTDPAMARPSNSNTPPAQARFQGLDPSFSAALSTVFAQTLERSAIEVSLGDAGNAKPFAMEFVSLPLRSASALTPVFALPPGAVDGDAWAQIHPDLADRPSVTALQVTLSRALGR